MTQHITATARWRDEMAARRRRVRGHIPATPEAVLEALGGSYTVGPYTRYRGAGCIQNLRGANGMEVELSDGRGCATTAVLLGPDPLMAALLESVARENARAGR